MNMSKHTSKHLQHNLPFIMFVLSHRNSQQIKRLRLHKLEMILECLKKKKKKKEGKPIILGPESFFC